MQAYGLITMPPALLVIGKDLFVEERLPMRQFFRLPANALLLSRTGFDDF
jgi:hypothetical protein